MFRITIDTYLDMYFLHKKFLWFWVKYSIKNEYGYKKNMTSSLKRLKDIFQRGKVDFSSGEAGHYYSLVDSSNPTGVKILYVENYEEFIDQYSEYLI